MTCVKHNLVYYLSLFFFFDNTFYEIERNKYFIFQYGLCPIYYTTSYKNTSKFIKGVPMLSDLNFKIEKYTLDPNHKLVRLELCQKIRQI